MYTSASIEKTLRTRIGSLENLRGAISKTQLIGAVAGLAGGLFAATSGVVFTVASWLVTTDGARQWLSIAGTVGFLLTIPLLLFGAYCMDCAEKNKQRHGSKVARREDDDGNQ